MVNRLKCTKRNKKKVKKVCKDKGISSAECRRMMARIKKGCKR